MIFSSLDYRVLKSFGQDKIFIMSEGGEVRGIEKEIYDKHAAESGDGVWARTWVLERFRSGRLLLEVINGLSNSQLRNLIKAVDTRIGEHYDTVNELADRIRAFKGGDLEMSQYAIDMNFLRDLKKALEDELQSRSKGVRTLQGEDLLIEPEPEEQGVLRRSIDGVRNFVKEATHFSAYFWDFPKKED